MFFTLRPIAQKLRISPAFLSCFLLLSISSQASAQVCEPPICTFQSITLAATAVTTYQITTSGKLTGIPINVTTVQFKIEFKKNVSGEFKTHITYESPQPAMNGMAIYNPGWISIAPQLDQQWQATVSGSYLDALGRNVTVSGISNIIIPNP